MTCVVTALMTCVVTALMTALMTCVVAALMTCLSACYRLVFAVITSGERGSEGEAQREEGFKCVGRGLVCSHDGCPYRLP
jgi:hypothetical protein